MLCVIRCSTTSGQTVKRFAVCFLFLLCSLFCCFALRGSNPFYFGNRCQIMARLRFFFSALQLDFPSMAIEYCFNTVPFFQFQRLYVVSCFAPCPHIVPDGFLWVCRVIF